MSTEYHEENKEALQKKLEKGIKISLKKGTTKHFKMHMNVIEIFQNNSHKLYKNLPEH